MARKLKQVNPRYSLKTKLRKGDEVIVLTGRSKGEVGKIETIDKKTGRVYLAGKNLVKKHQKPDLSHQDGGIVEVPAPLPISNVALIEGRSKKATRVGYKVESGKKVRIAKKSGAIIG